jgi:hypothetical protein
VTTDPCSVARGTYEEFVEQAVLERDYRELRRGSPVAHSDAGRWMRRRSEDDVITPYGFGSIFPAGTPPTAS